MTTRALRSQSSRLFRVRTATVPTVISLVVIAALAPAVLAGGTTIVVTTIPGGGWANSIDNTAGSSTQLVPFAEPGTLGNGSLALSVAANTDFAAVVHPFLPLGIPFSDLTGGAWRTFVTGAAGIPEEAAALKLPGFLDGLSDFTTLVVEPFRNLPAVTPMIWQDIALGPETVVWQTDTADDFCIQSDPCTFSEFTGNYPDGRFAAVQVALGTFAGAITAFTSYADGVSLTTLDGETEITETFDFDVVAAATPVPTVAPPDPAPAAPAPTPVASAATGGGGLPDTRSHVPNTPPDPALGIGLGSLVLLSAVTVEVVRRRRLSR